MSTKRSAQSRRWRLPNWLRNRNTLRQIAMYALSVLILIALWEIASVVIEAVKGRAFLPDPIRALSEVRRLGPTLFRNFLISGWRLVLSILIAFSVGYPLGLLIGHVRPLHQLNSPVVSLVYPIT